MVHKFDIIFLSETYLDSTLPLDDNLIYFDYPCNTKRGNFCLFFKNYLPLRVLNISYLIEHLNFENKIGDKSRSFIAFYPQASLKTILKPSLITLKWRWKLLGNVLFKGRLLVTLMLNPVSDIIMIDLASKVVPWKA